jgi:two-component system chemotaxis response regulator CheY
MPDTDGQEALRQIRALEDRHGIQGLERSKVVMTTALKDKDNVRSAFREQCDGYLVKPIRKDGLVSQLRELGLVP